MNQFTAIYSGNGDLINNIKYYDGFMGQRVGAISCLAFHPHWVCLHTPAEGMRGLGTGVEGSEWVGCSQATPTAQPVVVAPHEPLPWASSLRCPGASLQKRHQVACHSGKQPRPPHHLWPLY